MTTVRSPSVQPADPSEGGRLGESCVSSKNLTCSRSVRFVFAPLEMWYVNQSPAGWSKYRR
jgi:hypothetical protein